MGVTGRFCPVCGAEGMILWLGGYSGALYRCTKCDYIGPVVIERDIPPGEVPGTSSESGEEAEDAS